MRSDAAAMERIRCIEAMSVNILWKFEQHKVVMLLADAHKTDRSEGLGRSPIARQLQTANLAIELHRVFDVSNMDANACLSP
jgi:hypothetical protein